MIRGVRQGARWSAVLLTLGLLVGPAATVTAAETTTTDDAEAEAQHEVASVKVEMKTPRGRVVKLDGDLQVDWGVETGIDIEADGSTHSLQLMVQRKGEKKKSDKISITVGYTLDGEAIIAPYTFDSKVKKREVVRIEGGAAFAITITPKTIKGEGDEGTDEGEELPPEEVEPPRDKIEIEDEDDPLGGLEQ